MLKRQDSRGFITIYCKWLALCGRLEPPETKSHKPPERPAEIGHSEKRYSSFILSLCFWGQLHAKHLFFGKGGLLKLHLITNEYEF